MTIAAEFKLIDTSNHHGLIVAFELPALLGVRVRCINNVEATIWFSSVGSVCTRLIVNVYANSTHEINFRSSCCQEAFTSMNTTIETLGKGSCEAIEPVEGEQT